MLRLVLSSAAALTLSSCCCDFTKPTADAGTGGSGGNGGGSFSSGGGFAGTGGGFTGNGGAGGASNGGGQGGGVGATGGGSSMTGGGSGATGGGNGGGGFVSGPKPQITTPLAPVSGPYGTTLTILGTDFTDAGTLVLSSGTGDITLSSTALQADAGELWQDEMIVFRYPFPAEGIVLVATPNGLADAGAFVPSWVPGVSLSQDQDDYTPFPSSYLGAPGTAVGVIRYPDPPFVYGGWGVMIHDGVSPQLFHLDVPSAFVLTVGLVPVPGLQPDGIALVGMSAPDGGSTPGTLQRLTWSGGVPSLQPTGVQALNALGAGTDATGFFAWAQALDGGFIRVRPPTWTVDKTLAPPVGFGNGGKTSQIFFDNGTLVAQWTIGRDTGFPAFQHLEHPEFAFANGAQTAWNPTEVGVNEIVGQLDGVNVSTSSDGKLSFVSSGGYYSVAFLQVENPTFAEARKAGGGFVDTPTVSNGSPYVLSATATDFAGVACDTLGLRVLRPVPNPTAGGQVDATQAGEVAIWPCPLRPWQVVVDSDGGVMTLVESDDKRLYLVKKR